MNRLSFVLAFIFVISTFCCTGSEVVGKTTKRPELHKNKKQFKSTHDGLKHKIGWKPTTKALHLSSLHTNLVYGVPDKENGSITTKHSKGLTRTRTMSHRVDSDKISNLTTTNKNSKSIACQLKCASTTCVSFNETLCLWPGKVITDSCGCCLVCEYPPTHKNEEVTKTKTIIPSIPAQISGKACEKMICPEFKECILNIQGIPMCRCPNIYACKEASRDPVCTMEGDSFKNECFLKVEECLENRKIKIAYKGKCTAKKERKIQKEKERVRREKERKKKQRNRRENGQKGLERKERGGKKEKSKKSKQIFDTKTTRQFEVKPKKQHNQKKNVSKPPRNPIEFDEVKVTDKPKVRKDKLNKKRQRKKPRGRPEVIIATVESFKKNHKFN